MAKLPDHLILRQMQVGPMENFQYFLGDARSKEIAVVDPAWDAAYLCSQAKSEGLTIVSVFLTHGHPDHVNGLDELLRHHDVPAYLSKYEAPYYKPNHKNIVEVDDHQKLTVGGITFECLHTPGHTPGGQCFLHQNILVTGDTIFIGGCGRCDLPGGDARELYHSLSAVLGRLPDDTLLYTGHDYGPAPYADLGSQKRTNPYLRCASLEDFLHNRMGLAL